MAEQFLNAGNGRIWIQKDGCLNPWEYWGCYEVGTITEPKGDKTLFYCPSPASHGEYEVIASVKGAPGPVTLSLVTPYIIRTKIAAIECQFNMMVRSGFCERPDDPAGWEQILYLNNVDITTRTYDSLAVREPDDDTLAMVNADLAANLLRFYWALRWVDTGTAANVYVLNDVAFCDAPVCGSECGRGSAGCQVGYAVGDGGCPGDAPLLNTTDGGGTWTDLGTPFTTATDDISSVCCDGDFVIITNDETASIAYSVDAGVTWNEVTAGFNAAALINDCYLFNRQAIWLAAEAGYIYFSSDGGASWTEQEDGGITANAYNSIHGYDDQIVYAVGDGGVISKTLDGGTIWDALTSPTALALHTVFAIERETVFIGGDGGVWYSIDGGVTWVQITGITTPVLDIKFCGCNFAFMLTGGPTVYRSIDGGFSWTTETTGAVANLYAITCCDPNQLWAVGDNGQILKGSGV